MYYKRSGRWSLGQSWSELTAIGAQPQTEKYEEWGRHKPQNKNINTTWLMMSYPGVVSATIVSFVQPMENLAKPRERISTQCQFKVQPFLSATLYKQRFKVWFIEVCSSASASFSKIKKKNVSFTCCVPAKHGLVLFLNMDNLQRITDAYSDTSSLRQLREVPDVLEKDWCSLNTTLSPAPLISDISCDMSHALKACIHHHPAFGVNLKVEAVWMSTPSMCGPF